MFNGSFDCILKPVLTDIGGTGTLIYLINFKIRTRTGKCQDFQFLKYGLYSYEESHCLKDNFKMFSRKIHSKN